MNHVVKNLMVLLIRGHNVVAGELMALFVKNHFRFGRFPFLITKVLACHIIFFTPIFKQTNDNLLITAI